MDLPPDKAKFLKQYDDEKKWDIICDQVSRVSIIFAGLRFEICGERMELRCILYDNASG